MLEQHCQKTLGWTLENQLYNNEKYKIYRIYTLLLVICTNVHEKKININKLFITIERIMMTEWFKTQIKK